MSTSPSPVGLTIESRTTDTGVVVVALAGEAGVHQIDVLQDGLNRLLMKRPAKVVLDLSGVSFASSIGMGALVAFQRNLNRFGKLRLAAVQPMVHTALKRAALDVVFAIDPTLDDALIAFA